MKQPKLRFIGFTKEWETIKLKNLTQVITKGTTPCSFSDSGIKFIKVESLKNGSIIHEKCAYIPENIHNGALKRSRLEKNDILFSIAGALGETAVVHDNDLPANTNQALSIIRLKEKKFVNYLFHYLNTEKIKKYISFNTTVGAQPNLSLEQIGNINIKIPNDEEEINKISNLLSTVDRRIDLQRQLVDETRRLKTSVSQMLFSQKVRFKDDDGTEFPEWESKRLFDVGEITTGTTPSTKVRKYYGSDFLWITPTDIKNKEIKTTEKKLSKEGLAKGRRIPANSVLVTCIASIGKNCVLREEGSCNQQINAITPFNEIDVDFLYYLICFNEPLMHRYAGQGGMEMLNKEQFGNLVMDIPSFKEQLKIGKILTTLDNKIKKEENKLTELKNLKKGLLQQMFV